MFMLSRGRIILLICVLLLLYVIVPQIGSFSDSWAAVRAADINPILLGTTLVVLTYVIAASVYWLLAIKPLQFRSTLGVQAASAFTNRLLPAGLGTLTLYVQYLRKAKHTLPEALAVAGTNNILGIAGHVALLLAVLLLTAEPTYPVHLDLMPGKQLQLLLAGIVLVVLVNLLIFSRLRHTAYKITAEVLNSLMIYRKRPARLIIATLTSVLLTCCYVEIFFLCALSVNIHVPLQHIFVVFTAGMIVGTVTPTPGGLVGAEAGLTGGLIAYGIQPDTALATALLYRFLTYWLPILPGLAVFIRVRRLYG